MQELEDFYNDGTGWICRHCERELKQPQADGPSRLMTEGEAESKSPSMASPARAKWADAAQRFLLCPRCGIRELADKA
ncbi:MAG: hypothetical protein H0V76_01570 [Blastocatellia bacterium]|nr:hypothetical protein [Blastocatellia bacterium]